MLTPYNIFGPIMTNTNKHNITNAILDYMDSYQLLTGKDPTKLYISKEQYNTCFTDESKQVFETELYLDPESNSTYILGMEIVWL